MKKIIQLTLGMLLYMSMLHVVFSFIGWSFNPGDWKIFFRLLYVICFITLLFFLKRMTPEKITSPKAVGKSVSSLFEEKLKQLREYGEDN